MQKDHLKSSVILAIMLVVAGNGPLSGQGYDQRVPVNACKITQDSTCFPLANGGNYSVSKETYALSDSFNFCVEAGTTAGAKAARIILTIDRSASMCFDLTSCPGSARNDNENKRITAALTLIDSLKAKNPATQVGIVTFNTMGGANPIGPMALTDANVVILKDFVQNSSGKCTVAKSQAKKASFTYIGEAIKKAIQLADSNYVAVHDTLARHVILLTDGLWSDSLTSSPKQIMTWYRTTYPTHNPIPQVHTVFLSDSAWHVTNNKPVLGLEECNPVIPVIPAHLRFLGEIADSTLGWKIPPSTPQSIVANLLKLVESIVVLYPGLQNVWMYNITHAGTQSFGTTTLLQQLPSSSVYKIKLNQPLPLFPDVNTIRIIESIIRNGLTDLDTFTITINRTSNPITGSVDIGPLKQTCGIDTVRMEISANPTKLIPGGLVTVSAQIYPSDINKFAPDPLTLRAITPFTSDASTVALFHLDGDLTGLGASGNGSGSVTYAGGAFDRGLATGAQFSATLATPPSNNFLIDAWVKIVTDNQELTICSGNGMMFKININRQLVFQGSGALGTLTSNWRIDKNVWVHVAVARSSDMITLFANGVPISAQPSATSSTGALPAALTFGPCTAGYLDEVRVSSVNRIVSIGPIQTIPLPRATMTWHVGTATTTGDSAVLPSSLWNLTSGSVSFTATSTSSSNTNVIFNLFNARPFNSSAMWAKNSPSVSFENSDINSVSIVLTTPANQRIAGDTIWATVTIRNNSGLYPGTYCLRADSARGPAIFQDTLGHANRLPDTLIVGSTTQQLNGYPSTNITTDMCFVDGVATVGFVMHYAPYYNKSDSTHKISVQLRGITAKTDTFTLLPSDLNKIVLEKNGSPPIVYSDTLPPINYLTYTNATPLNIFAFGYDVYGNQIGVKECRWRTTGTLDSICRVGGDPTCNSTNSSNILYVTEFIEYDESGFITARSVEKPWIGDSLFLRIRGPGAIIDSAFTRDENGNGYLDRIDVYFRGNVLRDSIRNIVVDYNGLGFPTSTIVPQPGDSSKVYFISLTEPVSASSLQTGLTPTVTFFKPNNETMATKLCRDGAGPVIDSVWLVITNAKDRSKDVVRILLSENIKTNGNSANIFSYSTTAPLSVYTFWRDSFDLANTQYWVPLNALPVYQSITVFNARSSDVSTRDRSTEFPVNQKDTVFIDDSNWVNIQVTDLLVDMSGNKAVYINRKVQIHILTPASHDLGIIPNPAIPGGPPGYPSGVIAFDPSKTIPDVVNDHIGGTNIIIPELPIPQDPDERIHATIKIFDVVGNLVNYADNPNFQDGLRAGIQSVMLYWDGCNSKKMKVAPGVYRMVLYLDYKVNNKFDVKYLKSLGIGR